MKKLTLLTAFFISAITATQAQLPENFDASCLTAPVPGGGWTIFNPPSTPPGTEGIWKCTATNGKPNGSAATPGVFCTGFYSGAHHLDTSYLLTSLLTLSSSMYHGRVYLRFDSKKVNNSTTGRLAAVLSTDSASMVPDSVRIINDSSITPMLAERDATEWVTHEIDLTDSIDKRPFFFAFRFTSSTSASLAWYIDNIYLAEHSLAVDAVTKKELPIGIVGSTTSKIELSYSVATAGAYRVLLYDMLGREVYNGQLDAKTGAATYTINGLNLRPGMYCIKIGNENAYGTAKLIIE